jgi:hypothetical protein
MKKATTSWRSVRDRFERASLGSTIAGARQSFLSHAGRFAHLISGEHRTALLLGIYARHKQHIVVPCYWEQLLARAFVLRTGDHSLDDPEVVLDRLGFGGLSRLRQRLRHQLGDEVRHRLLVLHEAAKRKIAAYLASHQGKEAAAEFHKILDHRGVVLYEPIGALAHLQIGRAYAMQGDPAKAKVAYQDFLVLWKDADPDIPILKQAKAEYAKLQ